MSPPIAWSYSSLTAFETCPRRFFETRITKSIVEPQGAPLLLGNAGHKSLELRVTRGTPLPKILQVTDAGGSTISQSTTGWESMVEVILSKADDNTDVIAERQICLDDRFCETDWFSKTAWVRGVIDFGLLQGHKALLLDWKLGKRKPDNDQLELFAALSMHLWPALEKVVTGFVWLKTNQIDKKTFTRADIPKIWEKFLPRVKRLHQAHAENTWPERPSGLCKAWCPVHTCLHNGQYHAS